MALKKDATREEVVAELRRLATVYRKADERADALRRDWAPDEAVEAARRRASAAAVTARDIVDRYGVDIDPRRVFEPAWQGGTYAFLADAESGVICTCNFSHYSVLLDDMPDDAIVHGPGCPLADPDDFVPPED